MGAAGRQRPQLARRSRAAPGRSKAIDLDCNHIPDAAMTLAVMALYADGPSTLRNIASWRVKETDRIDAMANELRKLGATVEDGPGLHPRSSAARPRLARGQHPHLRRPPRGDVLLAGRLQSGRRCRCASSIRTASPRPSRTTSRPCSRCAKAVEVPVICIDGPTASGKGTLTVEVARSARLPLPRFGRALPRDRRWPCAAPAWTPTPRTRPGSPSSRAALPLRFSEGKVLLAGEDVSDAIRTEAAGMDASRVSALPAVRAALLGAAEQLPPPARPGGRRPRHGHGDLSRRHAQGLPHRQRRPPGRAAL